MTSSFGPDLASVDGNTVDWLAVAAHSTFTIIRAIYGRPTKDHPHGPTPDPVWATEASRARRAGLVTGGYLFLCYPRVGFTTPEPEVQVDAMVDYCKLEVGKDFPAFFDVEEESSLSASEYYDWTLRAYNRLEERYGCTPGMYTSNRVVVEYMHSRPAGELAEAPKWYAKPWPWPVRTQAQFVATPDSPTIPSGWGPWFWYQRQGDATHYPGFNRTVDVNMFRVVSVGAKGENVAWYQRRLNVAADGDFGPKTRAAVIAVQQENGLVQDGIIGPKTHAAIGWRLARRDDTGAVNQIR